MKANDFRTLQFLDWFVKEQGEEEKNANDLLGRFDLFASDVKGCMRWTLRWPPEPTPPPL